MVFAQKFNLSLSSYFDIRVTQTSIFAADENTFYSSPKQLELQQKIGWGNFCAVDRLL